MTLQEQINSSLVTWPTTVDETLQTTIIDWFQYREVVDDDKFNVYFNRVLNRDTGRYYQLLRLEPEISQFDWLIEHYLESKTEHTGSHTTTGSDSSTTTYGKGKTTSNTRTYGGSDTKTHTQDEATNFDSTINSETGNNSLTKTHTQNADNNYDSETATGSGSKSNTRTDNLSQTTNGTDNNTRTDNLLESNQNKDEKVLHQSYRDNVMRVDKLNPMSNSYTDDQINAGLTDHSGVPQLDWHYPTQQSQEVTERIYTGTEPDATTQDHNKANTGTQTNNKTIDETKTNTGTQKTDESSSANTDSTKKYNRDETNTESGTDSKSGNSKTAFNRNETNKTDYGQTITDNGSESTNGSDKTEGSKNSELTDNTADYTISTGRYGEPAVMLRKAVQYIQSTNAWEWLEQRLEVCFMGVYDV